MRINEATPKHLVSSSEMVYFNDELSQMNKKYLLQLHFNWTTFLKPIESQIIF